MVMRVLVRSRSGNLILAFFGAIYALSAIAVLGWFVVDVWMSGAMMDLLLQIALIAAAACGVWFLSIARQNLRGEHRAAHK
ncbi:MAG TPA: hypothetical protein VEK57_30665 [Thermoanaerobaculia bacterium]|nr:hypothetical protein [Thermoanaerobaculia bacterium]